MIICKGCKKNYPMKSIVQHVTKSNCKIYYSEEEEICLRNRSKEITNAKHRIKKAENQKLKKVQIAKRKAKSYQLKMVQIEEKTNKLEWPMKGKSKSE